MKHLRNKHITTPNIPFALLLAMQNVQHEKGAVHQEDNQEATTKSALFLKVIHYTFLKALKYSVIEAP